LCRYLRRAVEGALEGTNANRTYDTTNDNSVLQQEIDDLTQQNVKLRALLSTKREQIATLRTVLKSNKVWRQTLKQTTNKIHR
jgi:protein bicaudal D